MGLFVGISVFFAAVNAAALLVYGIDKGRASSGRWRVSERTLMVLAVLGGALGAFVGMRLFHHKTRKAKFRVIVPLLMVLQVAAYVLFAALNVYAADYYHADEKAAAALEPDAAVVVEEVEDGYFFDGPGAEIALVFYPGAKVDTTAYASLMRRIASEGIDCFLVDMPYHLAIFGMGKASGFMRSYDYGTWLVGGHSLGGAMAAAFAAQHSDEVDGVVLLAAYSTAALDKRMEVLCIYGSEDRVLDHDKYEASRGNLPPDTVEVIIEGGNHAQFGNYGEQAGDGEASISEDSQQSQAAAAIVSALG